MPTDNYNRAEWGSLSRRQFITGAGASTLAGIAGCTGIVEDIGGGSTGGRAVTDMAGREVTVPESVESLVAVGPGGIRMISQLDAEDMVVGVEENEQGWGTTIPYNMANPRYQDVPVIGPQFGGDPELIARESPDVVFWSRLDPSEADALQEKTGIPVVLITKDDFGPNREVVYDAWRLVGDVVGKPDRPETLIDYIETSIEDLDDRTSGVSDAEKDEAYAGGVSHRGPQGLQSTKAPFPPLEFVNAKFAASELHYEDEDRDRLKVSVSREKVIQWDPEVLFVDVVNLETVREDVRNNPEYEDLAAIRNDRVYAYHPYHQYHLNESTTLANAYFMGSVLFPDRFDDLALESKVNEIYETVLGSPVYDKMAEQYGEYRPVDIT